MESTRYRFNIEWLAELSAHWLWLVIPLMLGLTFWLYRFQVRRLSPPWRICLLSIRILFVVAALFLMFRPVLHIERTDTFGGRTLILVDDSPTMQLPLTHMPSNLRARLGDLLDRADPDDTVAALVVIAHFLRSAGDLQGDGFQSGTAYWEFLETSAPTVEAAIESLPENLRERHPDFWRSMTGFADTAARSEGEIRQMTHELSRELWILTRDLWSDSEANPAAPNDNGTLLALSRREAGEQLAQGFLEAQLADRFPSQHTIQTSGGNVVRILETALEDETRRPLDGVIWITDGRTPIDAHLLDRMVRAGVPLHTVGMGEPFESPDHAILSVELPPVAVAGEPLAYRLAAKTIAPPGSTSDSTSLQWSLDSASFAETEFTGQQQIHSKSGRMELPSGVSSGETTLRLSFEHQPWELTKENNTLELDLRLRAEPFRVVVVESAPSGWTTHFAHTIRRLPWVRLRVVAIDGDLTPDALETHLDADLLVIASGEAGIASGGIGNWISQSPIPVLFLGAIPSGIPETLPGTAEALPDPGNWQRTLSGSTAWPTREWPLAESEGASGIHPSGEIWIAAEEQNIWGWRKAEDEPLQIWIRLPSHRSSRNELEQPLTQVWPTLIEWIEAWSTAENLQSAIMPSRLREGLPLRVYAPADAGTPRLNAGEITADLIRSERFGPWAGHTFGPLEPGFWNLRWEAEGLGAQRLLVVPERARLGLLARDDASLLNWAGQSGGRFIPATFTDALIPHLRDSLREETERWTWALWSSAWILALLVLLLLAEWILRKRVGLL